MYDPGLHFDPSDEHSYTPEGVARKLQIILVGGGGAVRSYISFSEGSSRPCTLV